VPVTDDGSEETVGGEAGGGGVHERGIAANHYLPPPLATDPLHSVVLQPYVYVWQEVARLEAS
jgi:hypothetical protein